MADHGSLRRNRGRHRKTDNHYDSDERRRSVSSNHLQSTTDESHNTYATTTTNRSRNTDNRNHTGSQSPGNRRSQSNRKNKSDNQKAKHISAENKATLEIIWSLQKKLKNFKKKRLGPSSNYDYVNCAKCLEENILPDWSMSPGQIRDSEDFLSYSLRKPTSDEVMDSDEYMDLVAIAQRSQDFEILVPEVRRKVSHRLNSHVYKSCKSMKEECGDGIVVSAQEYEQNINKYISTIKEKSTEIDEEYSKYKSLTKPFLEFVRQGEQHASCMSNLSNTLLEVCKVVETWVKEDDEYPNKLMQETGDNGKKKDNLRDVILLNQERIRENKEEIKKISKSEDRAEKSYTERKKDKDRLKMRHAELVERREYYERKIAKKQDERDVLKQERQERGQLSPGESSEFLERLEAVEKSIERLERERKAADKQIRRVEKDLKPTSERTYESKVDYVENRNRRQELEKENKRRHDDIQDIQSRIAVINRQNETIRTIREIKLSPEAYRKVQREKRRRQIMESNGTKALADACQYAAPSIGKDWKKLYLRLPFDPPRDLEKLQRDIDNLDYFSARNDVTTDEQALKSLIKWQSFHRRGNVQDLVQTLRTIKRKRDVAREIERKFALSAA